LATQDDEPLVDALNKHEVVVAISTLEDPPIGAGDCSPILGERG
jgi:hypothetical protein